MNFEEKVESFKALAAERNMTFKESETETHVTFLTRETTKSGAQPVMIIAFNKKTTDAELYAATVTHVPDYVDDLPILNALNEFNQEFKYFRCVLDSDRDVTLASTLDLDLGFSADIVLQHSFMMFQAADEVNEYMQKLYTQVQ